MDKITNYMRRALDGARIFDPARLGPNQPERQVLDATTRYARSLLDEYCRVYHSNVTDFRFVYLDKQKVDAGATYDVGEKCALICVSTGLIFLLHDLFYRLLSHPRILVDIGDVWLESARHPYCSQGMLSIDYAKLLPNTGAVGQRLIDVLPRAANRKQYADGLFGYAFEFLIAHEFAHIAFGHCEYRYPSSRPCSLLMEMASQSSSTSSAMTDQAIEMAADAFAALTTFARGFQTPDDPRKIARGLLQRGTDLVTTRELFLFDWLFAIGMLFWMLSQDFDPTNVALGSHPPPPMRPILAASFIDTFSTFRPDGESKEHLERVWPRAEHEIFVALQEISAGNLIAKTNTFRKLMKDGTILNNHLNAITARWNEIKPDVLKLSHIPIN